MVNSGKCGPHIAAGLLITLAANFMSLVAQAAPTVALRAVSSDPDAVSGGDVLVRLSTATHSNWVADLDGRDVSSLFRAVESSADRLALFDHLQPGKNTLRVRIDGATVATLELLNHPLAGPIFSGPHQKPFICQTVANGLGPPIDSDCQAKTRVEYYYKSTESVQPPLSQTIGLAMGDQPGGLDPGFKAYIPDAPPPSDVAQVTTTDGKTVKYIVRREVGTINRAVYDIQFLHRPGEPLPTPWTGATPGWNGRLVYLFVGGCGAGYHQGTLLDIGKAQEPLLAQGYAVATSTLNIFYNGCNSKVSAETLSMVEERFIKQYGEPVHTIGWGGSGGAIQQYLTAQEHPGLLDGIVASVSFPDILNAIQSSSDCALLEHAFATSKQQFTDDQKAAVSGFASWRTCIMGWTSKFLDSSNCDPSLPRPEVYDRAINARGVRCDFFDNALNVFGRDPRTGFARRPLDNVGVQYGLRALQRDLISTEQFIDLNERIGGYDEDGTIIAARSSADVETLRIAYQQGVVLSGGGGLSRIPTIDWRPYLDDLADEHDVLRSFVTRARLIAASGSADNQVMLIDPMADMFRESVSFDLSTSLVAKRQRDLVRQMDLWLDRIAVDAVPGSPSERIERNKPAELAEGCWQVNGKRIVEKATYEGSGHCNTIYPAHGDPRLVAGAPLTDDVLKCALRPINPADYPQPLGTDQMRRLKALFPSGVCDYDRPGVGQQTLRVNSPLPPATVRETARIAAQ